MKFKIGDVVRPNPEHEDYECYKDQHRNNRGIIVKENYIIDHKEWVEVKWGHGHRNSYYPDMLILIDKTVEDTTGWEEVTRLKNDPTRIERKKEEVAKMYEIPFLPGQRVCLNPEGSRHSRLKQSSDNTAGYVLKIGINDNDIKRWSGIGNKENTSITVRFDNGWTGTCNFSDFLSIETTAKTIRKFEFSDGYAVWIIEGESLEDLDRMIIKEKYSLRRQIVYDNEWRAEILQTILNSEKKHVASTSTATITTHADVSQTPKVIANEDWFK